MSGQGWSVPPLLGAPPPVPGWVVGDVQQVRAASARLGESAVTLRSASRRLRGLLVDAAATLGWRADAATATGARAERAGSRLDAAAARLDEAAAALGRWADQVGWRGTEIESLVRRRAQAAGDVQYAAETADPSVAAVPWGVPEASSVAEAKTTVAAVDRQLQTHVDALVVVDRQVGEQVRRAAQALRLLAASSGGAEWVASLAVPQVLGLLSRYAVLPTGAERDLLAAVTFLPAGPEGAAALRSLLAGWTPDRLADLLLRHPDLAERLAEPLAGPFPVAGDLPPGSPEHRLATALAAAGALAPKDRIAAVRAFFRTLSPEQARRLALLYPSVVGNLDGAPLADRIAANRVAIGAALAAERRTLTDLERAVARQSDTEGWWARVNDELGLAAELPDAPARLEEAQARVALYENLLHEQVDNPARGPGRPERVGHQVLVFDPAGDGRIAELWGSINERTRHVAVFVPGTGADIANSEEYSGKMHRLVQDDQARSLAAISWIGTDLPDAVGANAPSPSYAEAGGPALRDFVWGLDVPEGADATAIGHSYGGALVGIADREGLEVDRVLHIASAGAGHGVFDVEGYGQPERGIDRYTMTAPGDFITNTRVDDDLQDLSGLGHGGDPDRMDGFTRLETGRLNDDGRNPGQMIQGFDAHSQVLTPKSTAWRNMLEVVTGGEVTPYTPDNPGYLPPPPDQPLAPPRWVDDAADGIGRPYEDPTFPGADPMDIR